MADVKLTRNERRQIDKLALHVHRLLDADIAFFKQHPHRRYRVRRAGDAEIAQAEILEGQLLEPGQGCCWFAIVKKEPGANIRMFVGNKPAPHGPNVPDDIAEAMWERAAPHAVRIVDLVTPRTDPAMATDRPYKITFAPQENTMLGTCYSKFLGERYASYWGTSPDELWATFAAATDSGVEFRLAPPGRKPFHAPTNQPTILVICDDNKKKAGPRAVHQESLREFVKRCTGAVIVSSEPRVVGYAAAASCAAGEGGRNVIIIETRARDDAEWSRALQAINPGLHFWFCVPD